MLQFGAVNMEEIEDKINVHNLPTGYTYLVVPEENIIRIKELTDQDSAKDWLKNYQRCTKTTWRKAATYPNCGKINIYRCDFRCVRLTDKRIKGTRSSKNTNCPAKLNIIIKRLITNSRAKVVDNLVSDWPAIVSFKASHNHSIVNAAALRYRDLSDESLEKLKSLFQQGHSPSSALQCLKTDLLRENSENYHQLVADSHYVPTLSVVHKIFKKEFDPGIQVVLIDEEQSNSSVADQVEIPESLISPQLTETEEMSFTNLISRINTGLKNHPNKFVPAVRNMLINTKKFAATETSLITALHTFGKYAASRRKKKNQPRRKHS